MPLRRFLSIWQTVLPVVASLGLAACAVQHPVISSQSPEAYNIQLGPVWKAGQKFGLDVKIEANIVQADAADVPVGTSPKTLYQMGQMPMWLDADGEVMEIGFDGGIKKMTLTVKSYKQSTQGNSLDALDQFLTPGTKIDIGWDPDGGAQYRINGQPAATGEYLFLGFMPLFFASETDKDLYGPKGTVKVGDTWQAGSEFSQCILIALRNQGFFGIGGLKGDIKLKSVEHFGEDLVETTVGNFTFTNAQSPAYDPFFWGLKPSFQFEITNIYPGAPRGIWKRTANLTAVAKGVPVSHGASSPVLEQVSPAGILTTVTIKTSVVITFQ